MKKYMEKYIGSKDFYKYVMVMVIPMIIQNLITNFVSMLDNIMVGQIGTAQMSGVSIVNQFMFIFNLTIFGGVSGASIFGTQFFGRGDYEGQKYTVRFRIIMSVVIVAAAGAVLKLFGGELISLFISGEDALDMLTATQHYGEEYLDIMLYSLVPFALGQAYSSVIRECGETAIPMYGSMAALFVNLILDYGLILGKLGMPCMGVKGAAIATVIAKFVEALVVIIWAHTHKERNKYIVGLYKGFHIPGHLALDMIKKGIPLLLNEFLWSLGNAVIAQSFSVRGLEVVAARNVSMTLINLFNIVFIQLGHCIGIIVGTRLGAGKLKEARDIDNKLVFFSVAITILITFITIPLASLFPELYNIEPQIKELASYYIVVQAIAMPIWAYTNACYFTLRSGGKTGITFLFDFLFSWVVMIPLAFGLAYFTDMEIHLLMAVVTFSEIIKVIVGHFLIRSDIWMNNMVAADRQV